MSTVLVIEDEFIASYDLEVRLKEKGYTVQLAATKAAAAQLFARLSKSRDLAAVVCDNRLISGTPAAVSIYRHVRSQSAEVPFVVYSGFPPHNLPRDDARLKVVQKPAVDDAIAFVEKFAPPRSNRQVSRPAEPRREAA